MSVQGIVARCVLRLRWLVLTIGVKYLFDRTYLPLIHSNIVMVLMHGRCPKGTEIRSVSECSKAAASAKLGDTGAMWDEHPRGTDDDPPFCYLEYGALKFNAGRNTGFCSKFDQCLCMGGHTHYIEGPFETSGDWDEEEFWEIQKYLEEQEYHGKFSVGKVSRPSGITYIIIICIF